ncbi:MAG: TonB-dependent receptor [Sphingobacterium sp.]|uniref:TonB-dependent receptor n=1 Tax=Sphingobacterium sp. TaxID=341027 RepID=UPI00284823DC|nr:TonB-dependent receptor [Sphingobacterium sp.]MDR3009542.1 TonB-dependent receptor [Sphingobacterium sp.]
MKLIILFLVIATFHVSANSYGQNISLRAKGESFKSILTKIRKQSGKDFLYNSQQIDEDKKMNLSITNKPLAEALRILLADQQLTYSVRNNAILIHPNASASASASASKDNTFQQDLRGKLKDNTGKPIAGATVLLVGTGQSVATDERGDFQFAKTPRSGELRINFIGFKEKTISFQQSQQLDITLEPQINEMEEVVVVGYGVQKKSDLTGSISAVQAKDFTQGSNINALQLINGKAPGVTISQTNSAPGAGTKIQVRGAGSINSSNDALIVVDGLPGIDPSSLSPDDIESIDILKDASAAAIYGTRAASGVVLITTKKGKSGTAIAKYDSYIGFQNVSKKLDVLNGKQYMQVLNAIRKDANKDAIFTEEQISNMGEGTNWQNEIFRKNAVVQNHQLSFSGGGEKSNFYTALNYFNQDGLVKNSGYAKINFRTNLEFRPKDYIKFNINGNYTRGNQQAIYTSNGVNEAAGPLNSALQFDPTLPAYLNENGRYYLNNFIALDNPLALINGKENRNISNTFYGLITAEIKPFNDFTATLRVGGSTANMMSSSYTDRSTINGLANGGLGSKNASSGHQWLGEFLLNYNKKIGKHQLAFLLGTTFEEFQSEGVGASSMKFLSDVTSYNLLQSGDGDKGDNVSSSKSRNRLNGVLGRINYNFNGRYFITASLRSDGTSRFSEENKFAFFPSGAFAWKLTDEDFLSHLKENGTMLKLRFGYGRLGNQGIDNYQTINTLVASGNAVFGDKIYQGVVPARLPNRNLRWESTEEINLGLDFELLRGRIMGSVDAYKRNTKDQLFSKPISSVVGFSNYMVNFGNVENRGIDFQLNSKNIIREQWQWSSLFNLALLKNEVKELPDFIPQLITGSIASFISNYQLVERGQPMLSFYGYETEGIFQNDAEIKNSAQPGAKPGHIRFKDQNQDGKIDLKDRTILGKPFPSINLSLSNTFRYKNVSLDFLLQYVGGISMLDANITETLYPTNEYRNRLSEYYLNRWTPENPTNQYPSGVNPTAYGGDYIINSMTVRDASFLRLKNINLNYEVLKNGKAVNRINIFLALENLATWTKYKGYDPDASATEKNAVSKVSYNSYPLARTIRLGLNLTL